MNSRWLKRFQIVWWLPDPPPDFETDGPGRIAIERVLSNPMPGRPATWSQPASYLLSALALGEAAGHVSEGTVREEIAGGVSGGIAEFIDEYCGTPPRPRRAGELASELILAAATLQAGNLRTQIEATAGRVLEVAAAQRQK